MSEKIKKIYEGISEKRIERGEITEQGYRIIAEREGISIDEAKRIYGA